MGFEKVSSDSILIIESYYDRSGLVNSIQPLTTFLDSDHPIFFEQSESYPKKVRTKKYGLIEGDVYRPTETFSFRPEMLLICKNEVVVSPEDALVIYVVEGFESIDSLGAPSRPYARSKIHIEKEYFLERRKYGYYSRIEANRHLLPIEVVFAVGFDNAEEFAYLCDVLRHYPDEVESAFMVESDKAALLDLFGNGSERLLDKLSDISNNYAATVAQYLYSITEFPEPSAPSQSKS